MKKVSIKTGMLATELGYRNYTDMWVFKTENGSLYGTNTKGGISGKEKTFQQPTQTELQTWLRKKGIEVYVTPVWEHDCSGYRPWVDGIGGYIEQDKKSYEQAMEYGLLLALKHLKSKKK
jgi:hypothetical protein